MRIAEREIDESLISAATWGDVADVRALLAQGADPSAFRSLDDGRRFWCALNYAIEEDHADVVACLVHAGADVNWSSQSHVGWTPLLHAVDAESDSANQTGSPMDLRLISPILAGAAIDLTVADFLHIDERFHLPIPLLAEIDIGLRCSLGLVLEAVQHVSNAESTSFPRGGPLPVRSGRDTPRHTPNLRDLPPGFPVVDDVGSTRCLSGPQPRSLPSRRVFRNNDRAPRCGGSRVSHVPSGGDSVTAPYRIPASSTGTTFRVSTSFRLFVFRG
jgi:hypothetical protein